jgi:SAM-dependent methyltransferase
VAALSLAACATPGDGHALADPPSFQPRVGQPGKDVIWEPTPHALVERMLDMAEVTPADFVVDLGSGDGRIPIAAAKRGARSRGIEYNADMVALSRRNAAASGLTTVEFVQADVFKTDFSNADVVTLYLLPVLNERLRPRLLAMKPGTRIASHRFDMGDWEPDAVEEGAGSRALMWYVPAKVEGTWHLSVDGESGPRLRLRQRYQRIEGDGVWGDRRSSLVGPTLSCARIRFAIPDAAGALQRFEGSADHEGRMSGTVASDAGGTQRRFTAVRR